VKIIIISGSAPPEPITAGRVHWDLANHLSQNNNSVWLITPGPSRPLGANYPKLSKTTIKRINDNFRHVRIKSFTFPDYNALLRAYESADFGIKAVRFINRKISDYDLIYASPWAFLGQFFILLLRNNKNIPVIMNVQDLYPESFLCKIKTKLLQRLLNPLYLIDKFIARKSTHITVISESLKEVYFKNRKIPQSKISILQNWQDESEFLKPLEPRIKILEKYNIKDLNGKFTYMYLGNIGPVAGVEKIITAFGELKNNNSALIIAGSGTYKLRCQAMAEQLQLTNVIFLEVPQGLKPVVELQSISDTLMLPIHPVAANSSIPSKLIAYMFSRKPVITSANLKSETAIVIKKSGCGWVTRSNNASEWSRIMNLVHETDKNILISMGRAGFEYAMKHYSRKEGVKNVSELLYKIKSKYYEKSNHSWRWWLYRRSPG